MRLLPCGDLAILVELDDAEHRRRLDSTLRSTPLRHVIEHVPAATTVLVRVDAPASLQQVADEIKALDLSRPIPAPVGRVVVIDVVYDGEDLNEVADMLGISTDEVVARHTGQMWTVEFTGFAAGFGYLKGDSGGLDVPRRNTPRSVVPAGAVALAGEYSGVYPRASPGGWQLIGRTSTEVWDDAANPPALLTPGTTVRFEGVGG